LEKNSEFLASGANTFEMDMVSREMYWQSAITQTKMSLINTLVIEKWKWWKTNLKLLLQYLSKDSKHWNSRNDLEMWFSHLWFLR
jgi:hypothetical protein